jgi:hypothetical protein
VSSEVLAVVLRSGEGGVSINMAALRDF